MKYIFGKDISRQFNPTQNNEHISLPTQTPTIYIFASNPSRTVARAGTGAAATISSWTELSTFPYTRTYTITAIADPDPTGITDYKDYWEAINYVAKTAGDTLTTIRHFRLERAAGTDSKPGTTVNDLKNIYPAITSYLTDDQLTQFIGIARDEMQLELEAQGLEWSKLSDLYKTKLALAYKTIALAALSQIKEQGDRHHIRYEEFTKRGVSALKTLDLPYDADGDGQAEAARPLRQEHVYLIR